MKKFSFSLEKVLDYKQQVLDAVQNEHAEAIANMRRQEDILENAWREYREYNEEFRKSKETGMMVTEAILFQSGLRAMEMQIQKESEKLDELKKIEEEKRNVVVEAKKETSSLEKLKEKKLDAYQKDAAKKEEEFIDEFVSSQRAAERSA